ncbi:MAG: FliO/MopB family protein [Candidatus Binatia bacterium]
MNEPGTIIGVLALALVGFLGVVAIVRRFAPQLGQRLQRAGRLQHLGSLSLTPQCSVALVRIEGEILVLGLTPHTVTLLTKAQDSGATEERNGATAKGQVSETAKPQCLNIGETETTL